MRSPQSLCAMIWINKGQRMALAWVTTENGIFNSAPHRGLPDGQCRLWVAGPDGRETRLPVFPEQRTSPDRHGWSVSCHEPTSPMRRGRNEKAAGGRLL